MVSHRKRLLLLVPDVAAEGGGIAAVNRSLMRCLGRKAREGALNLHVISLQSPTSPSNYQEIKDWVGPNFSHHGGSIPRFSIDVAGRVLSKVDWVFSTHLGLSRLLPFLPVVNRPSWGTFLHGLEAWTSLSWSRRKAVEFSDLLVSNSTFTATRCRELNPWFGECVTCWLGIPPSREAIELDVFERTLRFRPVRTDILIVGRMAMGEGMKGHEVLFEAMRAVRQAVPQARLIVVGGGNDVDRHKRLAAQGSVAHSILFTGPLSEPLLATLYENCGVFAMPSRQEGFGLVYAEAMRAGLPCLVSNQDAGQEIVPDGVCGFAVDPHDTKAIATRLIDLLNNHELRGCMAADCKDRLQKYFTEEAFHERFWKILETHLTKR